MKLATCFCLLLLFAGCGKKATEIDPNYVGHWIGDYSLTQCSRGTYNYFLDLYINENGQAEYEEYDGSLHCN